MPQKTLELRRDYAREYYHRNREQILARVKAHGKIHPRKRRKSFKNKMWCKDEDKPLWKKIFRKWLHYVHDKPQLIDRMVAEIKQRTDHSYFEKKKRSDEDRRAARRQTVARWMSKPGVRERFRAKRNFKRLKINGGMDRYYSNIQVRLTGLLKGRLYRLVSRKNFRVSYSMLELLDCTIAEFKLHLEKQFTPEMSWDNYGKGNDRRRWQIDHIIACRRFTLEKLEHQRVCFHFTNLRPLWQKINERKDSHPSIPKLTDAEVHAMHNKIYGTDIVPIDFPAPTGDENQPNKAAGSLQNIAAQLGT